MAYDIDPDMLTIPTPDQYLHQKHEMQQQIDLILSKINERTMRKEKSFRIGYHEIGGDADSKVDFVFDRAIQLLQERHWKITRHDEPGHRCIEVNF